MPRTDGDTWDITESVGATALGVAMARAAETQADCCRLFDDPYAQWFIDAAKARGWKPPFGDRESPPAIADRVRSVWAYAATRTKHFDEYVVAAGAAGIQQVVLLAAGLDARAWRLPWIGGTVVYEIDQPKVLAFKAATLRAHDALPAARVLPVPVDLRENWPLALRDAGFDATQPTAWLAEGLLPYLSAAAQNSLFERVQMLSVPDSRIAVEAFGPGYFDPEYQRQRKAAMQALCDTAATSGRELTDVSELFFNEPRPDVAEWLEAHGWETKSVTSAEVMHRHKRDPADESRDPRSVFVEGRLLAGG
jgi:methyltransferase (TIGR00027 family)